jgi:subtilisin family serine protease
MKLGFLLAALAVGAYGQAVPGEFVLELETQPAQSRSIRATRERATLRTALQRYPVEVTDTFDTVLNAMAIRVPEGQDPALWNLPGVRKVYPVLEVRPHLDRAATIHNAPAAWEKVWGRENAGSGIKIGIIDTGIDQSHPAFTTSGMQTPEGYPKASPEFNAGFTNSKVIVARAYGTAVSSARDLVGHGTSVASAAAAVLHESSEGWVSGMAPKAWLGNYKVFPDTSSGAPTTLIIRAIEDAVQDGMDIINMSLGSDVAPDPNEDILVRAVENAVARGVIVVISAGNSGPEWNTIASPGTSPSALTVGNSSNDRAFAAAVLSDTNRSIIAQPGSLSSGRPPVSGPLRSVATFDTSGLGCGALPSGSLTGSVALILRGVCTFEEKLNFAAAAGAVGAVVYTDPERPDLITMSVNTASLPASLIGNAEGRALLEDLSKGPVTVTLRFTSGPVSVNPNRLASSSSRGPSVDGRVKPELLAVGAPLYMAVPGATWRAATGTSFSAPLVAGAAAVLKAAKPGLTALQYRSILINSACAFPGDGTTLPVTWTGAGLLDMDAALNSTTVLSPPILAMNLTQEVEFRNITETPQRYSFGGGEYIIEIPAGESLVIPFPLPYNGAQGTVDPQPGLRLPFWFAEPQTEPQSITILTAPTNVAAGATASILFKALDANGLPAANLEPTAEAGQANMEVLELSPASFASPGAWRLRFRTAPSNGTQTVTIKAGGIQRTVSLIVSF